MTVNNAISFVTLELLNEDDSVYTSLGVGGGRMNLYVESIAMNITRTPIVVSLPTGRQNAKGKPIEDNRPVAWALDLGSAQEMISLSGVIGDNNEDPLVPNISELQEIVRTHWATVSTSSEGGPSGLMKMSGGARLRINMGPGQGGEKSFQGIIARFDSSRVGGTLRWEWKMVFQVASWPKGMDLVK